MKSILTILTIIFVFAFSSNLSSQNFESGSEYCYLRQINKKRLIDKNTVNQLISNIDILNYKMDLDIRNCFISPYPNSFTGNVLLTFKAKTNVDSILLDASNYSLVIDSVRLSGVSFSHKYDILTINLNRTYQKDEIAEVLIYYKHKDVQDFAFYADFGHVFTDCEPEGARFWFPCWDRPNDKAKTDITVKVPSTVMVGSVGTLVDSTLHGDVLTYRWVSRDPVATYLVVLAGKVNYQLDIVNWTNPYNNEVEPIRFYYNVGEDPSNITSMISELADYFSKEFCPHPFEKNGFATLSSEFMWGGMENQTLTTLCKNCWGESLIVHEFAHQWFGDMITCDTWADIWLNEGFATWSEAFWMEKKHGHDNYLIMMKNKADGYMSSGSGGVISDPNWVNQTPPANVLFEYGITYLKGCCVLHQLRYVLGDSMFFDCLKAYAADTNFKYKSATIQQFKEKVETVSGEELDWFFDSWIYKPYHPRYQNRYFKEKISDNKYKLHFIASQEMAQGNYWQMPLELGVKFANGDTLLRFFNSENNQGFVFEFDEEPLEVVFDPRKEYVLKEANLTNITSVDEKPQLNVSISPMPFSEKATLKFQLLTMSNVKISLFDALGKQISILENKPLNSGFHEFEIDGSKLIRGIYFINIQTNTTNEVLKIVKL